MRKRLGVDVAQLIRRQCELRTFNRECDASSVENEDPNSVRVCVPTGWSIQFGASVFPLPTPRRLVTGAPVELDRAGYLGLARGRLIDDIVEQRLSDEIEPDIRDAANRSRTDPSALRSFHVLQARWLAELAEVAP